MMIQSVWKNLTGLQKAAEHLWCEFKYRPWAKNSSPNTDDLYIHYMDKSTGRPPSLEEKNALPNCGNKDGNIIHVLKNCISTWRKWLYHMSLVLGDEFLAHGLHLKSHQRCSAAFCRPVKFFHTDWIIISLWSLPYTQMHCHVRIEKGSVQTVAIKLEVYKIPRISLYAYTLRFVLMEITKVIKPFIRRGWPNTFFFLMTLKNNFVLNKPR